MKYAIALALLFVGGCGYSEIGTEAVGQVKRVVNENPLICDGFTTVDLSLGVMQNGVGSMSTHDVYLTVTDLADIHALKVAAETGKLVKLTYDEKRFTFCVHNKIVKSVTILP